MKTNIIMQSSDRELFGITIRQQTKDKYVSVTDLQKAYDKARWQYGWGVKNHSMIMKSNEFLERVYHVLNETGMIKLSIDSFMGMIEKEGVVATLKGLNVWKTTGRGDNKAVYADPYIWTLLAMELNPLLYAKVIVWVTDTLIFDRIEAGSEYKPMNTAIRSIVSNPDYSVYAKAINNNVFGRHETGMRNMASSKELKKIAEIEKFVTQAIGMGIVKNSADILQVIVRFN